MSKKFTRGKISRTFNNADVKIIEELSSYGIKTIAELDNVIPKDYESNVIKYDEDTNYIGMLRDIMIINDTKRYFEEVWDKSWSGIDIGTINLYKVYGIDANELFDKYGVTL